MGGSGIEPVGDAFVFSGINSLSYAGPAFPHQVPRGCGALTALVLLSYPMDI